MGLYKQQITKQIFQDFPYIDVQQSNQYSVYGLGLDIVLQGQKEIIIRDQVFKYAAGQSMLTTIDLPVISRVTQASYAAPFLGVMLSLDLDLIIETVLGFDKKIKV